MPGLALIENASDAIADPVAIVANVHVFELRFDIVINGRVLRLIGNVTLTNRKLEWSNQNCRVVNYFINLKIDRFVIKIHQVDINSASLLSVLINYLIKPVHGVLGLVPFSHAD